MAVRQSGGKRYARGFMGKRQLGMLVVPALLLACGSSPKPQSFADPPASGSASSRGSSATAAPSSDKPETEGQRRVRLGLLRREQCRAVGNAIQSAQRDDTIINVNDTAALQRSARALQQSTAAIEAVEVSDQGLGRLRGEYVANARDMSTQLGLMASAKNEAGRRAASKKFAACQDKVAGYIQRLNEHCNAPVR
jgi:hypothetical protein